MDQEIIVVPVVNFFRMYLIGYESVLKCDSSKQMIQTNVDSMFKYGTITDKQTTEIETIGNQTIFNQRCAEIQNMISDKKRTYQKLRLKSSNKGNPIISYAMMQDEPQMYVRENNQLRIVSEENDMLSKTIKVIQEMIDLQKTRPILNKMIEIFFHPKYGKLLDDIQSNMKNKTIVFPAFYLFPMMCRIIFDKNLPENVKRIKLKHILSDALQEYYEHKKLIVLVHTKKEINKRHYDFNFLFRNPNFCKKFDMYDGEELKRHKMIEINQNALLDSVMQYRKVIFDMIADSPYDLLKTDTEINYEKLRKVSNEKTLKNDSIIEIHNKI